MRKLRSPGHVTSQQDNETANRKRLLQMGRSGTTLALTFHFDAELVRAINTANLKGQWVDANTNRASDNPFTLRVREGIEPCRYVLPVKPETTNALFSVLKDYPFSASENTIKTVKDVAAKANKTPAAPPTDNLLQIANQSVNQSTNQSATTRPEQPLADNGNAPSINRPTITVVVNQRIGHPKYGQAKTLEIRAPRHPDKPDHLFNGYPNDGLYETVMAQPGARYIKSRKGSANRPARAGYFVVPISTAMPALLKTLNEKYGLRIDQTPITLPNASGTGDTEYKPARLIAEAVGRLKNNIRLSMADDLADETSPIPVPQNLDYLPYQKAGIRYALNAGNALIADEPGLGKTIQAIGVSNALPHARTILVIPPASLKINWRKEWQKWCAKGLSVERVTSGAPSAWPGVDTRSPEQVAADNANPDQANPNPGVNVVVVNYDLIEAHADKIYGHQWDMLIVDEAHALKTPTAKRTKAVLGYGSGKKRVEGISADRTLLLTGTPILNRPAELWPLVHALDSDAFSDKFAFEKRYCDGHQTQFGWNAKGASNLQELQRELRSRFMVRRQKSQVLKDLPPKTRQIIELDAPDQAMARGAYRQLNTATKTLRKLYRQREELRKSFRNSPPATAAQKQAYREQAKRLKQESEIAFHRMSEIRKDTAIAKIPQVMELAKTALDNGKVILFCHHREVAEAYRDNFNQLFKKAAGKNGTPNTVAMITGGTPEKQRQPEADRFQEDPNCRLFIGSIGAAGTGYTLTEASTVLFAELDYVYSNITQAEDRAHRIGQKDHVLVYHAVISGSLDSLMIRHLINKQAISESALDQPGKTPKPATEPEGEQAGFAHWCMEHLSGYQTTETGAPVESGTSETVNLTEATDDQDDLADLEAILR